MNCFSHAYRFVDRDPFFVVGTSIPDWLGMADRRVRVRRELASRFAFDGDLRVGELARGIVQHHDDDAWFHTSQAFAEMQVAFTRQISGMLEGDTSFRSHFVAHVTLEMLIDAELTAIDRGRLDRYYQMVQNVDANELESIINRISSRSTSRLVEFLARFIRERFLYDYLRDAGVVYRLNRILSALGLAALPAPYERWVGSVRESVRERLDVLLSVPPGHREFELASAGSRWRKAGEPVGNS